MNSGTYVDKNALGNAIKDYRAKNGLSQEELAKSLHTQKSSISSYENAHSLPSLENTVQLAQMLRVSIEELIGMDPLELKPISTHADFVRMVNILLSHRSCFKLEEDSQGEPHILFNNENIKDYFKIRLAKEILFYNKQRKDLSEDEIRQERLYSTLLASLLEIMENKPIF